MIRTLDITFDKSKMTEEERFLIVEAFAKLEKVIGASCTVNSNQEIIWRLQDEKIKDSRPGFLSEKWENDVGDAVDCFYDTMCRFDLINIFDECCPFYDDLLCYWLNKKEE